MTIGLGVLPRFQVRSVETCKNGDLLVRGVPVGREPGERPGWFWLWMSESDVIALVIEKEDDGVLARIAAEDRRGSIEVGDEIPWMRAYWDAHHVRMIQRGEWRPQVFSPRDAVWFELNGVQGRSPIEVGAPAEAGETVVVSGGWDHEHCEICRIAIGTGGFASGYLDPEDHWICAHCYDRWAKRPALGFLAGEE